MKNFITTKWNEFIDKMIASQIESNIDDDSIESYGLHQ
jgi:hypothetical protein